MSDSIISISLLNGKFDTNSSNLEIIKNTEKTRLIIKPKTFKDLYKQIFSETKYEENQIILGILSNDKKKINNDNFEHYKDKISIYLGCSQDDSDSSFNSTLNIEEETLIKLESIEVPSNNKLVDTQKEEILTLKNKLSGEIEEVQNKLFDSFKNEFDENLKKNLSESLNDIVLKFSKKNIQKVENLRNSVKSVSKKFLERANSCMDLTKQNSEKIKEIKKLIIHKKDDKDEKELKEVIIHKKEEKDEKIFEFCDNPIFYEETVNNPKFEIKNIKIKNISKDKDYQSNMLVWLKDENSNEELNFVQDEIKNEFAFIKDQNYPKQKEIDNLTLNLFIKEPKVQKYKILISIKDKETNKIISKKPLEIAVSMALDLNYIWTILKQLEFFELLDNNDEIFKKIYSENGNLNTIKDWVTKEINNKKESIIKDLLVKFQEDFKSTTAGEDESKKREIILEKKFDEKQIKKWIEDNSAKPNLDQKPEEIDKHLNDKKEEEIDNHKKDEKAEEIYNKLNEELKVDDFLDKEKVIAIIIDYKYDIEKIREWVEDKM